MSLRILTGDCLHTMATLPDGGVQCCVTSPPYFNLRSYLPDGHPDKAKEIGAEPTLDEYVARLVDVFREVRRLLRDDGVAFLNIGDTMLRKQLLGVPWRVALASSNRTAGICVVRSSGTNSRRFLESCADRPTSAHEHVFLLAKHANYFFDAAAIAEPSVIGAGAVRNITPRGKGVASTRKDGDRFGVVNDGTRNARNVQTWATSPYSDAHHATMPLDMASWCIKAGSRPGDTVLDCFGGAGTTGLAADRLAQRDPVRTRPRPTWRWRETASSMTRRCWSPPHERHSARPQAAGGPARPPPPQRRPRGGARVVARAAAAGPRTADLPASAAPIARRDAGTLRRDPPLQARQSGRLDHGNRHAVPRRVRPRVRSVPQAWTKSGSGRKGSAMARNNAPIPSSYSHIDGWAREPELIARNIGMLNWWLAGYSPLLIARLHDVPVKDVARVIYQAHAAGDDRAAHRARVGRTR